MEFLSRSWFLPGSREGNKGFLDRLFAENREDYFPFFSFLTFRFSFSVSAGFFWTSFLPLSFLPVSPTSVLHCSWFAA